ncbi:MAG: M56 family metallopeptidase [Planctomycetota bacterium]
MSPLVKNYERKARAYFTMMVGINLVVLFIVVAGMVTGIRGYIADTLFTYHAVTCCGSVCSQCFFTLHTFFTALPWLCIVILFVGISLAVRKAFSMVSWNYRFIRPLIPLPVENHPRLKNILSRVRLNGQLVLFDNPKLCYAFTSGILKPKIYLSTGLCSYLTNKELLAVAVHEAHHTQDWAPLKLFIARIFHAINFFLPINSYLLNGYITASEMAADDTAVHISGEPLELASALVKLSRYDNMDKLSTAALFSQGPAIVEDRLRRILSPEIPPPCRGKAYLCLAYILSLFTAVSICLTLFHRSFISDHTIECKAKVCHTAVCG